MVFDGKRKEEGKDRPRQRMERLFLYETPPYI